MKKQKLIAITGPSASGKTRLAIELAKELDGEIISADSRQIYKELEIGSAKPTIEEREGIPHHLLDIVDLTQDYTVANFCDDAKATIKDIESRGKTPIIAGGTGLYFRVLLQDFELPRVAPNPQLRSELEAKSSDELYKMLSNLDLESAEKIHPNNKVKIIRALEVCLTLGIPMSKAQGKKPHNENIIWCGLNAKDRDFLYERINKRVDIMIESGLLNEAENLFKKYPENKILLSTIGYQEFFSYFQNSANLEDCIMLLKQNTRRYAKRQISWFNANKEMNWFDIQTQSLAEIKAAITEKFKTL